MKCKLSSSFLASFSYEIHISFSLIYFNYFDYFNIEKL